MENSETLETFLIWLGQNRTSGAQKYEEVRRKLIYLFKCRGCRTPEELADETIDRTAKAIQRTGFTFHGDPIAYLRGVARNVYLESLRNVRRLKEEPFSESSASFSPLRADSGDPEIVATCLEQCLAELPVAKRELLLRYYSDDGRGKIDGRQKLAGVEGIGLNALRIQLFRLRSGVRNCVLNCLNSKEM